MMSEQTSLQVFNGYFDIKSSDLWKSGNEMYVGFDLTEKILKTEPKIRMSIGIEKQLHILKMYFDKNFIDEKEYEV